MMANQILARYAEGQVVIAFGQVFGPYEQPLSKDTEDKLRSEGLPVRAVAQIAVAPGKLAVMLEALNGLLTRIPPIVAEEAKLPRVKQP
ncbi:MAG: hypothetical protein HYX93_03915 [Chloroflexi bacterium]|nr:hypothetical protein [Chloroflexota bacterium]